MCMLKWKAVMHDKNLSVLIAYALESEKKNWVYIKFCHFLSV